MQETALEIRFFIIRNIKKNQQSILAKHARKSRIIIEAHNGPTRTEEQSEPKSSPIHSTRVGSNGLG